MTNFWGQKSFVLITGASRGLGRAMAIDFSRRVAPGSFLLLTARTVPDLAITKKLVQKSSPSIHVVTVPLDLAYPNSPDFKNLIQNSLVGLGSSQTNFEHAILVHNAVTVDGRYELKLSQYEDLTAMEDYYRTNFASMALLTSQFLRHFPGDQEKRSVIQITSIAGVVPCKTLGQYGSIKAARGMYMKILAAEEPSITTLSYAPGGMDTPAYHQVRLHSSDPEMRKVFDDAYNGGLLASVEESARKLAEILQYGQHTKGEHTDFYETKFENGVAKIEQSEANDLLRNLS